MTGERSNTAAPGLTPSTVKPLRVPASEELPLLVPRTALGVIDEAVTFLRIEPGLLLGIALIVLVPMRIMALAFPGSPLRDARPDQLFDIFLGNVDAPGAVLAAFATMLLESIALFTVAAIYGSIVESWYSSRPVTASELLVGSIRRSPLLFIGWALVHVAEAAAGFVSLGLGVIVLGPMMIATAPLMGAEKVGPWKAVRRSLSLCGERYVHCVLVFVFSGIAALVIRGAIRALPSVVGLELLNLPLWAVSGVADVIASVVVTAFIAATATILYLDVRIRREGIDLDMAMVMAFRADRRRTAGR